MAASYKRRGEATDEESGKGQKLGDLTNLYPFEHLGACGVMRRNTAPKLILIVHSDTYLELARNPI